MIRFAIILAGGQSRRFGSDKLTHHVKGVPMLSRVVAVAREALLEPFVAGRAPGPGDDWQGRGDEMLGAGPLAGIATGLSRVKGPALVLAGDAPMWTRDDLEWLMSEDDPSCEVLVTATPEGKWQPLFAIWRPSMLDRIREALSRQDYALHRCIAACDHRVVMIPPERLPRLVNMNTPKDIP